MQRNKESGLSTVDYGKLENRGQKRNDHSYDFSKRQKRPEARWSKTHPALKRERGRERERGGEKKAKSISSEHHQLLLGHTWKETCLRSRMPLHHLDFLLISLLGTFCLVSLTAFVGSSSRFNPSDSGGGGAAVVAAAASFCFSVLAEAGLQSSPLHPSATWKEDLGSPFFFFCKTVTELLFVFG